jgi:queuosine precursor transporter
VTIWVIKLLWEVAATPLTYAVVGALKRHEGIGVCEVDSDFNPFRLRRA